jgi:hypothetical protein
MSVSIALLPIALALRIVMGKENFENWAKSQQQTVLTSFSTELELTRAVKKAGYDVIKFGTSLKTHLDGEKTFFFWECVAGRWQANFSKSHDQAMLNRFIADVEKVMGTKVFGEQDKIKALATQFPTNFRDGALLIEALNEFGAKPIKKSNGDIVCKIDNSELLFKQDGDSPFTVEIKNSPQLEEVYRYLSDIDDDYKRCVQTAVYEKVMARAGERNLMVESEEVLADKTILVTLRVS